MTHVPMMLHSAPLDINDPCIISADFGLQSVGFTPFDELGILDL